MFILLHPVGRCPMNLGSWCNSIEGTAVEVIKVCTTPTQFWKSKTRNKLVLVPVMPGSCIEILIKEKAQIQRCRELAAKWKKQTFSAQKNPSNWRLTWIQQMKKLAAISCKGNDKICTVWTPKKLSRSTRHDRIHSCCFKSRMLTHTACLHQKRRKGCLVLIPICYRNCCGTEQSIYHIYINFWNRKFHMAKHRRWYLCFNTVFSVRDVFFSTRLLWKWKNMQCCRQWPKTKRIELMADLYSMGF